MRPRSVVRVLLAVVAAGLSVTAVARLSGSPVSTGNAKVSSLRLSWSARPERIETCRTLSKEELEKREEHMRQRVECEGRFATYALRVMVGETLVHESVVRGAGLRHDRPIYLLRDIEIPTGDHRVRVSFTRREKTGGDSAIVDTDHDEPDDSGVFHGRAEREREERARRARAAIPPRLVLDSTISFSPGKVVVVTLDSERGTLVLLRRD